MSGIWGWLGVERSALRGTVFTHNLDLLRYFTHSSGSARATLFPSTPFRRSFSMPNHNGSKSEHHSRDNPGKSHQLIISRLPEQTNQGAIKTAVGPARTRPNQCIVHDCNAIDDHQHTHETSEKTHGNHPSSCVRTKDSAMGAKNPNLLGMNQAPQLYGSRIPDRPRSIKVKSYSASAQCSRPNPGARNNAPRPRYRHSSAEKPTA